MAIQGKWSFGSRFNPRSRISTYIYSKGSDDERYVSLPRMMAKLAEKDLVGIKKGKATSKDLSPKAREEIAVLQKEYAGLKDKGISFRSVMKNKQEAKEAWYNSPGFEESYRKSRLGWTGTRSRTTPVRTTAKIQSRAPVYTITAPVKPESKFNPKARSKVVAKVKEKIKAKPARTTALSRRDRAGGRIRT